MRKDMISKALVLGVIFLFIGVGFKPAVALEPKLSVEKEERVEDCDCREGNTPNPTMVKLLLNKLKIFTDILVLRYGHISEVDVACNEALELINSINPTASVRPICNVLEGMYHNFVYLAVTSLINFLNYVVEDKENLAILSLITCFTSIIIVYITVFTGAILLCSWVFEEKQEFNILKNGISLNLQTIQNSFSDLV